MTAIRGIFAPIETVLARRSELVVIISVVVLFIVFSSTVGENFLTNLAISNIVTFTTILGIIVLGVAVLMISGEFDLSVGSMFAVVGFTFGVLLVEGLDPWLAVVISVAAGALLGFLNGVFVVGSGNPSFIITLGLLLGYRGVARAIGGGSSVRVSYEEGASPVLFDILNSPITFLNMLSVNTPDMSSTEMMSPGLAGNWQTSIFWFVLFMLIFILVIHRSKFGNWIYATGGNPDAAQAQGVPVKRVKMIAFIIVGVMVAAAAIINFSERRSIDPLAGSLWELFAVAACVMGGLRLKGGFGTILGAVLGTLMIPMLRQGLLIAGFSVEFFQAVFGFALISVAALNQYLGRANN